MKKEHVQFLVSGVLFGFLVGYLIAYAVHEPRVKSEAAPVPSAGNMGMSGGPGAGASAAGAEPGGDHAMAMIFQEINALKAAIEKDPKDARSLVRLANLYHDAAKFDQAVAFYERALEVQPRDVDARTDMGICMREMGRSDDAIAQFRTSLSYDPRHWQTWLNLGVVTLFDKQDVRSATEAFAKVEELNPTFKDLPLLKDALRKAAAAPARQTS